MERRKIALMACAPLWALFAQPAVAGDAWTPEEQITEVICLATLAADYGQTLDIANHPGQSETNVILGRHPKRGQVSAYFLTYALIQFGVADALPHRWRTRYQLLIIGMEGQALYSNYGLGLKFAF